MKEGLAIMQPYIFPYLGYFHLIEATRKIVFYDDVNYIKRGWVNRNRILLNNVDFLFTVPVEKASQNKLINEIRPKLNADFERKFFGLIKVAYSRAPFYNNIVELLKYVFSGDYNDIGDLAIKSILSVYQYMGENINWTKSSFVSPESRGTDRADRLIKICLDLEYNSYRNSIGGQSLYGKDYFKSNGVELRFVDPILKGYKQFGGDFIPGLSIIDILMFNDQNALKDHFNSYRLV